VSSLFVGDLSRLPYVFMPPTFSDNVLKDTITKTRKIESTKKNIRQVGIDISHFRPGSEKNINKNPEHPVNPVK
jgi:hypothetical protein